MLNKPILSQESVEFNLEFMNWLTRNFGAPHAPPIPSPLHRNIPLFHRHWDEDDQRCVSVWVEDELAHLKTQCHMQEWQVVVRPVEDFPPLMEGHTPVIAYDPERCAEPGYFASLVLIRLAEILIDSQLDVDNLSEDVLLQLKTLTICYLGQGLTLAAMPSPYLVSLMEGDHLTKPGARLVVNRALFGTALALTCRRFSVDNLMSTYGSLLSKKDYKILWNAMKQLSSYETEIHMLKMLCGKGEQRSVTEFPMAMSA